MMRGTHGVIASGFSGSVETDPYWANVVALLHMDGSDASTTFTDETGRVWSTTGSAQIDTAQSLFGGASGLFDGSADYISTVNSSAFDFGTGDFTIELAARRNGAGTGDRFLVERGNGADFLLRWNASGDLQFFLESTLIVSKASFAFTIGTWYRIAVSRVSGTCYLFVDGNQEASASSSQNVTGSAVTRIGGYTSSDSFAGHIDEVRITKGVGRYSGNYTVATSAFPNS